MDSISVSVIVPVYNTAEYLDECIRSLLIQGLKNYEIIIINDGSTDNSNDIIKKYLPNNPQIKYFLQENIGLGATRNRGVHLSSGKYIYFMDSDDYLEENALNNLFMLAEEKNLDAVFFNAKSFFDDDNNNKEILSDYYRKEYGFYKSGEDMMSDFLTNNDFKSSSCLYIVKKDILVSNNLKFIPGILHEDELHTVKLFLNIGKCEHVDNTYFHRRVRANSIMTSSKTKKRFEGYFTTFIILDKIYKNHVFSSPQNKSSFTIKLKDIFRHLYTLIHFDEGVVTKEEKDTLDLISKEYNYFGVSGYLFANNLKLYFLLRKLEKIIKKAR